MHICPHEAPTSLACDGITKSMKRHEHPNIETANPTEATSPAANMKLFEWRQFVSSVMSVHLVALLWYSSLFVMLILYHLHGVPIVTHLMIFTDQFLLLFAQTLGALSAERLSPVTMVPNAPTSVGRNVRSKY